MEMLALLRGLSVKEVELWRISIIGDHGSALHLLVTQISKTIDDFVTPGVTHSYFIDSTGGCIVLKV
jgi:hypothetical protein